MKIKDRLDNLKKLSLTDISDKARKITEKVFEKGNCGRSVGMNLCYWNELTWKPIYTLRLSNSYLKHTWKGLIVACRKIVVIPNNIQLKQDTLFVFMTLNLILATLHLQIQPNKPSN